MIFGLGNPGTRFRHTFHNIGREFLEYLAAKYSKQPKWETKKRLNSEILELKIENVPVILARSTLFMNDSGRTLKKLIAFYQINISNLIIIHDDSDLEFGKIKIAKQSGSAGHHGVESLISHLKTKKFIRIRIGVRPKSVSAKAGAFVLKKLSPAQKNTLETLTYPSILQTLLAELPKTT